MTIIRRPLDRGVDIVTASEIFRSIHYLVTSAIGGTGGDLRWRSSLRLSPAPPIYGVMGDHGSPAGTSGRLVISTWSRVLWGRQILDFEDIDYQRITITPPADTPEKRRVGGLAIK